MNAVTIKCQGIYEDIAKQAHTLIAGQTGSGKSVIINSLIHYLLLSNNNQLILIDPKLIELSDYSAFPHCIRYASDPREMANALQYAVDIMMYRYKIMRQQRQKKHTGSHIYIIIDELADLITPRKAATPAETAAARAAAEHIERIGRLGRAANIHLIVATQYLGRTIPPEIKRNLTAVIGLHTRTADDSRYLIESAGCEKLKTGQCLYIRPGIDKPMQLTIQYTGEDAQRQETDMLLAYWRQQTPSR